ncbi:MAG: hypothetical protein IJ578_04880, partial [Bacteroidales bacterium]|nr:hypothetical protein [Bacteroidales bacterium]
AAFPFSTFWAAAPAIGRSSPRLSLMLFDIMSEFVIKNRCRAERIFSFNPPRIYSFFLNFAPVLRTIAPYILRQD